MLLIYGIFSFCSTILTIPDISQWYTNNITDMSEIFYGCKSLLSLPDISKWNKIMLFICMECLLVVLLYHICQIYHCGILTMFLIWDLFFWIAHLYHLCQIYQNGILIMFMIWIEFFPNVYHYHLYLI